MYVNSTLNIIFTPRMKGGVLVSLILLNLDSSSRSDFKEGRKKS